MSISKTGASAEKIEASDFGKDLGLIHELVITARKIGAGKDFFSSLAHNQELFKDVVEFSKYFNPRIFFSEFNTIVDWGEINFHDDQIFDFDGSYGTKKILPRPWPEEIDLHAMILKEKISMPELIKELEEIGATPIVELEEIGFLINRQARGQERDDLIKDPALQITSNLPIKKNIFFLKERRGAGFKDSTFYLSLAYIKNTGWCLTVPHSYDNDKTIFATGAKIFFKKN